MVVKVEAKKGVRTFLEEYEKASPERKRKFRASKEALESLFRLYETNATIKKEATRVKTEIHNQFIAQKVW